MAEETKDNAIAETETGQTDSSESPVTGSGEQVEAAGTEEKAEEKTGKKDKMKKAAAGSRVEDSSVKPFFIGDLNYLPGVREDIPALRPGDVVGVSYRVIEGGKERTQVFEGTIIAIKNSGVSKTITVRKTSFGIAVERIFPLNSKLVQSIDVKKHSRVRRAKLYYLRNLKGKAARLKEVR